MMLDLVTYSMGEPFKYHFGSSQVADYVNVTVTSRDERHIQVLLLPLSEARRLMRCLQPHAPGIPVSFDEFTRALIAMRVKDVFSAHFQCDELLQCCLTSLQRGVITQIKSYDRIADIRIEIAEYLAL